MYNKKLIVWVVVLFLIFMIVFYHKNEIYSRYVYKYTLWVESVQEYVGWENVHLEIVWEDRWFWSEGYSFMQIDWNVDWVRKKIAVLYKCNVYCSVLSIAVDNLWNWKVIEWDNKSIDWIEDWWE